MSTPSTLACALLFASFDDPCVDLRELIDATYTFRPSQLTKEEQKEKGSAMDAVWSLVKADSARLVPCLREALADPRADAFFRFDGSALLVDVDPSRENKAIQVHHWCEADLVDVDRKSWIQGLAALAREGFDVSEAGRRWVTGANPTFVVPEHGLFSVGRLEGALFLFGSMDEAQALPALRQMVAADDEPARSIACVLLGLQHTAEGREALSGVEVSLLLPEEGDILTSVLEAQPARAVQPDFTRESLVAALEAYERTGDRGALEELESCAAALAAFWAAGGQPPEREAELLKRDFVDHAFAVLTVADVPLVRRVRRLGLRRVSDEAIDMYMDYSRLLQGLVTKDA